MNQNKKVLTGDQYKFALRTLKEYYDHLSNIEHDKYPFDAEALGYGIKINFSINEENNS